MNDGLPNQSSQLCPSQKSLSYNLYLTYCKFCTAHCAFDQESQPPEEVKLLLTSDLEFLYIDSKPDAGKLIAIILSVI